MITLFRREQGRLLVLVIVVSLLLIGSPVVASQPVERTCAEDTAPADNYQSQGVGLTLPELTALYGPNDVGQGSLFFDMDGVQLHKVDCDLILVFPWTRTSSKSMRSRWRNRCCRPMRSSSG